MPVLGLRYCLVAPPEEAEAISSVFTGLGLWNTLDGGPAGSIFPTEDGASWAEIWPAGDGMPEGVMLQLVVDDADAYAVRAKEAGFAPEGPMDAHGERIYFLRLPGNRQMSFQSALGVA